MIVKHWRKGFLNFCDVRFATSAVLYLILRKFFSGTFRHNNTNWNTHCAIIWMCEIFFSYKRMTDKQKVIQSTPLIIIVLMNVTVSRNMMPCLMASWCGTLELASFRCRIISKMEMVIFCGELVTSCAAALNNIPAECSLCQQRCEKYTSHTRARILQTEYLAHCQIVTWNSPICLLPHATQ